MALKKRLNTDQSIQPLVAQYVRLNLIIGNDDDDALKSAKRAFVTQYPAEGNTIPKVFVIRADGEKLFAASFKADLPVFLSEYLQQSGTPLSDSDLARLESAVATAKTAIEKQDVPVAIQTLKSAPGSGSYATSAVEAAELVKSIKEQADEEIARAGELLDEDDSIYEGALLVSRAVKMYSKLPEQKRAAGQVMRKYKANETAAAALEQAEAFVRVQTREKSKDKTLAVTGYQSIVKNYPGSYVAELSSERLAALGVETPDVSTTPTNPTAGSDPRTWVSSNGKFKIRAIMVQSNATHVQLKTDAGKLITVPLGKLSPPDVQFIKDNAAG